MSRRRRRESGSSDPLGKGNTQLLNSLAVTPKAFYDVRKNLSQSGGNVSSLLDVSGAGTYGPSLTPPSTAPTWDGTVINTNATSYLKSSSTITGADVSTQLTVVYVGDWGATAGKVPWELGNGAVFWRGLVSTGPVFRTTSLSNTAGATGTAATGTGNVRVVAMTVNVAGTDTLTIEVPATAKVTSGSAAALASTAGTLTIGATFAGSAGSAVKFRALLIWSGGYTSGQLSTLVTWAQTYHGAVAA